MRRDIAERRKIGRGAWVQSIRFSRRFINEEREREFCFFDEGHSFIGETKGNPSRIAQRSDGCNSPQPLCTAKTKAQRDRKRYQAAKERACVPGYRQRIDSVRVTLSLRRKAKREAVHETSKSVFDLLKDLKGNVHSGVDLSTPCKAETRRVQRETLGLWRSVPRAKIKRFSMGYVRMAQNT